MVDVEYQERIAILRLNRPPVNAVNVDLLRATDVALGQVAGYDDLAALIVTGAGKVFCAGLHLKDVPSYSRGGQRERCPPQSVAVSAVPGAVELRLSELSRMDSGVGTPPSRGVRAGVNRTAGLLGTNAVTAAAPADAAHARDLGGDGD